MGRVFTARYPGRCSACNDRIDEGDDVSFDATDEVVHESCDPDSYY